MSDTVLFRTTAVPTATVSPPPNAFAVFPAIVEASTRTSEAGVERMPPPSVPPAAFSVSRLRRTRSVPVFAIPPPPPPAVFREMATSITVRTPLCIAISMVSIAF